MSRNREPKSGARLPHDKEPAAQPYAREVEDYTNGVAKAPDERPGGGRGPRDRR